MPEDWRKPFRVDECGNRVGAGALALVIPGFLLGVVAAVHEGVTGATGLSLAEVVFAYFVVSPTFAITFGVLLGIPFVLAWDRFLGGPRWAFVAAATVFAAIVGALVYGWPGVFAIGGALMSSVFVALLRLPDDLPPIAPRP